LVTMEHDVGAVGDLDPELADWFAALGGRIVAVGSIDAGTYAEWFAAHDATSALQRPDFHVHGVARDAGGAVALLADLRRRLV